jgi:hypothetical protein
MVSKNDFVSVKDSFDTPWGVAFQDMVAEWIKCGLWRS